jgi:hypothetical protein
MIAITAIPLLAGNLTVTLPPDVKVADATATPDGAAAIDGKIAADKVTFTDVPTDTPLNVSLKLADGTQLQGVDMGWYSDEPADTDATPLTDDDREAVRAIVQDIPSFYNRSAILALNGDHSRVVALVELVRDSDFHASGGNVVWRIELYYFKFQYGGWEKVQQQNKLLRRERFESVNAYHAATDKLKWSPNLGGISVGKDESKTVPASLTPTTNPAN